MYLDSRGHGVQIIQHSHPFANAVHVEISDDINPEFGHHTGEVQGSIPCASTIKGPVKSGLFHFEHIDCSALTGSFKSGKIRGFLVPRSCPRLALDVHICTVAIFKLCNVWETMDDVMGQKGWWTESGEHSTSWSPLPARHAIST